MRLITSYIRRLLLRGKPHATGRSAGTPEHIPKQEAAAIAPGNDMAAKKGNNRQPVGLMPDSQRVKIQNSNILNALIEHVMGNRKMSSTQVSAGLGLMKKVLPDLASVDLKGTGPEGEIIFKTIYLPAPK